MRLIRPIGLLAVVLLLAALPAASTATGVQPGPGQCGGPAGPPCPPGDSALIQIAKSAVPSVLPAGGGPVTYTYTVTNGGTVPLTVVTVSDDKCAPVVFVGGDTNANTALDVAETWTFSCTTTITTTTINVATAQGTDPSGSGTKASASVTVTVGCPPGTTNCVPPPYPSGTTDPNCPPPPCPPWHNRAELPAAASHQDDPGLRVLRPAQLARPAEGRSVDHEELRE